MDNPSYHPFCVPTWSQLKRPKKNHGIFSWVSELRCQNNAITMLSAFTPNLKHHHGAQLLSLSPFPNIDQDGEHHFQWWNATNTHISASFRELAQLCQLYRGRPFSWVDEFLGWNPWKSVPYCCRWLELSAGIQGLHLAPWFSNLRCIHQICCGPPNALLLTCVPKITPFPWPLTAVSQVK